MASSYIIPHPLKRKGSCLLPLYSEQVSDRDGLQLDLSPQPPAPIPTSSVPPLKKRELFSLKVETSGD